MGWSMAMVAQDSAEPFDVVDEEGQFLGKTKARSEVHRDGDWHRSLHIWVVLEEAGREPLLLFQKRSAGKDTWPGALDVSVSGHYRAGETLADGLREAVEEIGVEILERDIRHLFVRKRSDRTKAGIVDNELQDILTARVKGSLRDIKPSVDEVEWIVACPVREAVALFEGECDEIGGMAIMARAGEPFFVRVRREDFVVDGDGYYARAARMVVE